MVVSEVGNKINSEMYLILLSFCHSVIIPTPSCSFLNDLAISTFSLITADL